MYTLQEWHSFYKNLKVWTCPYHSTYFSYPSMWRNVRNDEEYTALSDFFIWNPKEGLALVAGKKGCMVLWFRKDENTQYSKESLQKVLSILGLPENYEWVYENPYQYHIVLDVCQLPKGNIQMKYRDFNLVWEECCMLPPGDPHYPLHFAFSYPMHHPQQIPWSVLSEKILLINEEHLLEDYFVVNKRKNKELLAKIATITIGIIIFGLLCALTVYMSEEFTWPTFFKVFFGSLVFYAVIFYITHH